MSIKSILKKIIGKRKIYKYRYCKKISNCQNKNIINELIISKVYNSYSSLLSNVNLSDSLSNFFYSIDVNKTYYYDNAVIDNLMIDYKNILDKSLEDYKKEINKLNHENDLFKREIDLLNGLDILIDREIKLTTHDDIIKSLKGIKNRKADSFKDALQRILFFNQILWQTNHTLNGLGRLDLILDSYYKKDLKEKKISKERVKELIKDFLLTLHRDYYFKSAALAGDTGQIIILGGIDKNNKYFCNDLTYLFIEILEELKIPDPKVLLRVSKKMPKDLMELSLKCILTGIGCPLFANDDIIISKLIDFGYDKEDAYNYGTAACWEPYIPGKSFDQSNMESISFMEPLSKLLENESLSDIKNFDILIKEYYKYMNDYLKEFKDNIDNRKYAKDAILSLMNDNCILSVKDISEGGAKYNNYGFTGVGLSNSVNSLLTIDKYVFKEKKYSFVEFNNIRKNNYENNDTVLKCIKNEEIRYGVDNKDVIELSNNIINEASNYFKDKVNPLGGKYKFGLSAPSYIMSSKDFPASFDGRKNGEPFGVHISSDKANGYTELVSFASQLDYGDNRFNGNVVDFFVTPNFIKDNFDKFVDFLMISIKKGFF